MQVLITAASKHGATAEIADALAEPLRARGMTTTVRTPEDVTSVDGFDAVLIGSAVYAGHWLEPARHLVERLGEDLRSRHVWLFSSGPVGDPPRPEDDAVDVAELMDATAAQDHRVFAGRIDKSRLGFAERAIVRALRVPEGDYRDWDAIRSWADDVADRLEQVTG